MGPSSATQLIVVLGSPNDVDGRLGPVARTRIDAALSVHRERPDVSILVTGGFGPGFNLSPEPHHVHVGRALVASGVPAELLLPGVDSTNTAEDASLSCEVASSVGAERLIVVTSDFHEERASLFFARATQVAVEFRTASSRSLDAAHRRQLVAHETAWLTRLRAGDAPDGER